MRVLSLAVGLTLLLVGQSPLSASPASPLIETIRRELERGNVRLADAARQRLVALGESGSTAALLVIGDSRELPKLRLFLMNVPAEVGHRAALLSYERIASDARESHALRVAARNSLQTLKDKLGIRRPGRVDGGVEWTRVGPSLGPGCDGTLASSLEKKRALVERCLAGAARGSLRDKGELVVRGRYAPPRVVVSSVERDGQKLALPFLCARRQLGLPLSPAPSGSCTVEWRFPFKR